jgi:hypothetical protein
VKLYPDEAQKEIYNNSQLSLLKHTQVGSQRVKRNFNDPKLLQLIPTIVNGRVIPKVQNTRDSYTSGNDIKPCDFVSETPTMMKSNCSKETYKLVMIRDSFLRGAAENVKSYLSDKYEVLSIVKPGVGLSVLTSL